VRRPFGRGRLAARAATRDPVVSAFLALVVAATAFVAAAAPGLLERVQTDTVRHGLDSVARAGLDLTATARGVPAQGGGAGSTASALDGEVAAVWGSALDELDSLRGGLDPRLRAVMGAPRIAVLHDRLPVRKRQADSPAPRTELIVAVDPFLDERVDYVDGVAPRVSSVAPAPAAGASPEGASPAAPLSIALSEGVAESLNWPVGESRLLAVSASSGIEAELSGVFRARDAGDGDWGHLPASLHPSIEQSGTSLPLYVGVAFLSPASPPADSALAPLAYFETWYPFRTDRVESRSARDLTGLLRRFSSASSPFDVDRSEGAAGLLFTSGAPRQFEIAQPRVDGTGAVLAVLASGPAAAAAASLLLAIRMLALRRRGLVTLARARGASGPALLALFAAEGVAVGAPAAFAGAALGAVSGTSWSTALVVGLLVAVVPAVALPVSVLMSGRRTRSEDGPRTAIGRILRAVPDLVVTVLAVVGVTLVLLRGRTGIDAPGADPLLTAIPVILAALGAVVTIRLLPLLLEVLESRARRRAGLIALLGPARARRDSSARVAPVLAVVIGAATAIFSGGVVATVDSGIDAAARALVGADLRAASYLPPAEVERVRALDCVAAVAPVYTDQPVIGSAPDGRVRLRVYVVDAAELRAVQGDAAWGLPQPAELGAPARDEVPVIASSEVAALIGAETLEVRGAPLDFAAVAPSSGPLGAARMWVAVDRVNADRIVDDYYAASALLVDLEPGTATAGAAAAVRDVVGAGATIDTPAAAAAVRRHDPALTGITEAVVGALAVVGVALAVAVATTLVLGSGARSRLVALLRAFGFGRRRGTLRLLLWEVAPALGLAVPIGVLAGLALATVVLRTVELSPFVGGEAAPDPVLVGPLTLLPFAAFLLVAAVSVTVAVVVAARASAAEATRTSDEGDRR